MTVTVSLTRILTSQDGCLWDFFHGHYLDLWSPRNVGGNHSHISRGCLHRCSETFTKLIGTVSSHKIVVQFLASFHVALGCLGQGPCLL